MKKITLFLSAITASCLSLLAQTDTSNNKNELQELVVKGIHASEKRPLTFSNLDRKRIEKLYYGADIPSLLQVTPSVNMYSDNGTGIGYSYFRLRGMDQTRINTTVNGIPVNDPENQGVFFNNFADLASSAEQIQVQRGIGTSTNGTSAFGGSVNINTRFLSQKPEAAVNTGFGSFGSSRLTAEMQTGLLNNHWMLYARLGQIKTNGYRDNSGSQIQSYQFSLGYVNGKSVLKFNFFGGNAQSKLAYSGIDKATMDTARKTNPFVNGESDAFKQYFNQVQYTYQISKNQSISASGYLVKSSAPKFQYYSLFGYGYDYYNMYGSFIYSPKPGDTILSENVMSSYRLDQTFFGGFLNYHGDFGAFAIDAGLHANKFVSDHFMEVNSINFVPPGIQPNNLAYFNTGTKMEQSAFVKVNYDITSSLSLYADVQARASSFSYKERVMQFRPSYGSAEKMNWLFINPRIGSRYEINSKEAVYLFVGMSSREPTRFDYMQDDFATHNIKQNEIKPEQVIDIELGYTANFKALTCKLNAFAMQFQNQIVGTGELNNFGYQITGNIGKSFRRGIEIDIQGKINNHLRYWISSSFSENRIEKLNQTYFNLDSGFNQVITYKNTPLALSPERIHNIGLQSFWFKNVFNADISVRYVSLQYLDNTANKDLSIPAFSLMDMNFGLNLGSWFENILPAISFRISNVLNQKYAPSGSVNGSYTISGNGVRGQNSLFYPAAGRNYFVTLSLRF